MFDHPKPTSLLKYLINSVTSDDKEAIVLDFFAGSGSTAHATLALNAEDDGHRRFVMVQLPEPTPEDSVARKAGFENIADLSRRRIDLAGDRLDEPTDDGDLDIGYRTYKLVDTNFSKWRVESDIEPDALEQRLIELRDSSEDNATTDDLLVEVLLKQGYSLSEEVATVDVAGLQVSTVDDNRLLAYLDEHVQPTLDQLRALADIQPSKLVILEDSFKGDDELKTNLAQICKAKDIELWTA